MSSLPTCPMITLFTSARPFNDPHINIIQRNALTSWTMLRPKCEIFLIGDEEGTTQVTSELGIIHIPEVKKNKEGKPLKSAVFLEARKRASYNILCFVNADIILLSDFLEAIQKISLPSFLLTGRRWDLDVKESINFDDPLWERRLSAGIKREGKLHGPSALDYAVFPKHVSLNMPPFAMNRGGWDNWIIWRFKTLGIPVIDATKVITSIHQNHPTHLVKNLWKDNPQARKELKLAGGFSSLLTLREADLLLTPQGLQNVPLPRMILSRLASFGIWRLLLAAKRWGQQYI